MRWRIWAGNSACRDVWKAFRYLGKRWTSKDIAKTIIRRLVHQRVVKVELLNAWKASAYWGSREMISLQNPTTRWQYVLIEELP